jgi:VanZ family protein
MLMGVIFLASSTPSTSMPNFGLVDLLVKKGGHMLGYGLLGLLFYRAIQQPGRRGFLLAYVLTVLYAASDEYHQSFVFGRGSTWVDVVIDGTGALVALFLISRWPWLRRAVNTIVPEPDRFGKQSA